MLANKSRKFKYKLLDMCNEQCLINEQLVITTYDNN